MGGQPYADIAVDLDETDLAAIVVAADRFQTLQGEMHVVAGHEVSLVAERMPNHVWGLGVFAEFLIRCHADPGSDPACAGTYERPAESGDRIPYEISSPDVPPRVRMGCP